ARSRRTSRRPVPDPGAAANPAPSAIGRRCGRTGRVRPEAGPPTGETVHSWRVRLLPSARPELIGLRVVLAAEVWDQDVRRLIGCDPRVEHVDETEPHH